jgi:cytochrome c biogenesis protein CcdA
MLVSASKRRIIQVGSVYIVAVYITYFLAGVGIFYFMQFLAPVRKIMIIIFAILLAVLAIIDIKDYFFYGKGISLKIPESKKEKIKRLVNKSTIPSAIVLGFLVSAWELPCTGGVYLGILALLADTATKAQAIGYLLVYNIFFVLPLIVILLLMVFGMQEKHLHHYVEKHKRNMRLIIGIVMLLLAIFLIWSLR